MDTVLSYLNTTKSKSRPSRPSRSRQRDDAGIPTATSSPPPHSETSVPARPANTPVPTPLPGPPGDADARGATAPVDRMSPIAAASSPGRASTSDRGSSTAPARIRHSRMQRTKRSEEWSRSAAASSGSSPRAKRLSSTSSRLGAHDRGRTPRPALPCIGDPPGS